MIPDTALDDRLGIVGSGKTYGAGVCVERLLARAEAALAWMEDQCGRAPSLVNIYGKWVRR